MSCMYTFTFSYSSNNFCLRKIKCCLPKNRESCIKKTVCIKGKENIINSIIRHIKFYCSCSCDVFYINLILPNVRVTSCRNDNEKEEIENVRDVVENFFEECITKIQASEIYDVIVEEQDSRDEIEEQENYGSAPFEYISQFLQK